MQKILSASSSGYTLRADSPGRHTLEVVTMNGSTVLRRTCLGAGEYVLSRTAFTPGIYVLKFYDGTAVSSRTIVF